MLSEYSEMIRTICIFIFFSYFSYTDLKMREISNKAVLVCFAVGVMMALVNLEIGILVNCFGGCLAAFFIFLFINLVTKDQIGMGDVKAVACLGLYTGLQNVFSIIIMALAATSLAGMLMILLKRGTRKSQLPFAPFVLCGIGIHAVIGVFFQ